MGDSDPNRPADARMVEGGIRFYSRKLQRHPGYRGASRVWRIIRKLPANAWRVATHRYRELPSVVIVGAQKAGTTQLYESLIRHPACFGGARKELNYFTDWSFLPVWWYRSRFPLTQRLHRVRGLCLEASPAYLATPSALQQIHETLPNAKIIAVLRDPVARAFSQYQHNKSRYRESRSFEAAVHEIIAGGTLPPKPGAALSAGVKPMLDYVSRGYYALQLEALWKFVPREQTLVLDCADLFDDTNGVCQRVFDFIGLQRHDVTLKKVFNRGYYRETIDPEFAAELRAHYRAHDQLLVELTGQSFRWMQSHAAVVGAQPDTRKANLAA